MLPKIIIAAWGVVWLAAAGMSPSAVAQYALQSGSANLFEAASVTASPSTVDAIVGDFNSDGAPDLLAFDGSTERFYTASSSGAYAEATGAQNPFRNITDAVFSTRPHVFVVDITGSGFDDLVVFDYDTGGNGRLRFLENTDGSTYERRTGAGNPFSGIAVTGTAGTADAIVGDFNSDGAPDLLAFDGTTERFYENEAPGGTLAFTERTGPDNPFDGIGQAFQTSANTLVADITGNGFVDVAFRTPSGTQTDWMFFENVDGSTYVPQTGSDNPLRNVAADASTQSLAAVMGDFNFNGTRDLLTADAGAQRFYTRDATGTFVEQTGPASPFDQVATAFGTQANTFVRDPDQDGDADLFFAETNAFQYVERTDLGIALFSGRGAAAGGSDYTPPAPVPGTTNNPIGRFSLSTLSPANGALLSALTLGFDAVDAEGITDVTLWTASTDVFDAGTATPVASTNTFAPSILFDALGLPLTNSPTTFFVTTSLSPDAAGDIAVFIDRAEDLGLTRAALAQVDGTAQSTLPTPAFLAATAQALPVEMTSFTATQQNSRVYLAWTTATETNNSGFEVQHAPPAPIQVGAPRPRNWQAIDMVPGAGTTSAPQSYRFQTEPLGVGRHAFRLRQIDADGAATLSSPVEVVVSVEGAYALDALAPNPTQGLLSTRLSVATSQTVRVVLYDVTGRRLEQVFEGRLRPNTPLPIRVDASRRPSGIYFLRVQGDTFTGTRRIVVVR